MQRILEILFGLKKDFLGNENVTFHFKPLWPWQEQLGPGLWNFVLIALAALLVWHVYRSEGRSRAARISLGVLRFGLLLLVIALLNNPVATLTEVRTDPSVVAVLIDQSESTTVADFRNDAKAAPIKRYDAILRLLSADDQKLIRELNRQHILRFYRFNWNPTELAELLKNEMGKTGPATQPDSPAARKLTDALAGLKFDGQSTQVVSSLRTVLQDLQGQRLAGVVLITDGRSIPAEDTGSALADIKNLGGKVYTIAVGSTDAPKDLAVEAVKVQSDVFVDDVATLTATVRGSGYPPGHKVRVVLRKDNEQGPPLRRADGKDCEEIIEIRPGQAQEVELPFKPAEKGDLKVVVQVEDLAGPGAQPEVDRRNNTRAVQVAVLDAKIHVLYVDGYPRWEYRYLVREMIRDKTVDISCLLLSADQGFIQEGDRPITRFPETIQEMMDFDVVLFGDVDPRQFTDRQIMLVHEFVARKGGGFGMVAGPRWAPTRFRGTQIEAILPVNISDVEEARPEMLTAGFRPVVTREGEASSVFRFFADKRVNQKYLKEDLQPIFWYCRGVRVKPGVGEVYAEHPNDVDRRDGRKAPLLVLGRFGMGRTLFSGIDDSWRWRYYTGEQVFDNYWVQQLRYLARGRKLGERKFLFTADRPVYSVGQRIRLNLRVLDPEKVQQLPAEIGVELLDEKNRPVGRKTLSRSDNEQDVYEAIWTADTFGKFTVRLPSLDGSGPPVDRVFEVVRDSGELTQPQADLRLLASVASETGGEMVPYNEAQAKLPAIIRSRDFKTEVSHHEPLWDAPLAMVLFVLLITVEWVLRKVYGML